MKRFLFLLPAVALVLGCLSCRKPEVKPEKSEPVNIPLTRGVPHDPDSIHGYLYVGYKFSLQWGLNRTRNTLAFFGDPARPLAQNFNPDFEQLMFSSMQSANVSVNRLTMNGSPLNFNSSGIAFYELRQNHFGIKQATQWSAAGNGSFLPFDVTLPELPSIIDSSLVTTIPSDKPFTVDFNKHFANYDSVVVTLGNSGSGSYDQNAPALHLSEVGLAASDHTRS